MTPQLIGRTMAREMAQQPAVLAAIGARLPELADQLQRLVGARRPPGVAFLARGSSDNAALLGRYAIELATGRPTSLVAPSLPNSYGGELDGFRDWLVVAVSQSGSTPEIVDLSARFKRAGARVLAITNDAASPLATSSAVSFALDAGPEIAVPATKTVSGQMLTMLGIASGLAGETLDGVDRLADLVEGVVEHAAGMDALADWLSGYHRFAVVARGFCYAAARETALKLQETTGAMAHAFSAADFLHGPIATAGRRAPALLVAGSGAADQDTLSLRGPLADRGAPTRTIGSQAPADVGFPVATAGFECILATIRGQQLALATCRRLGIDPDAPNGLNKITMTT
jgi:glucosamine--fructose-6-phosphate aminotransferase (isomerizing)